MIRSAILVVLCALMSGIEAFAPPSFNRVSTKVPTTLNVLLSEEETDSILQTAHDCAEGECSVDDVSGLIAELKEQQKAMNTRLTEVMNMVAHLQKLNTQKTRETEDVRAYVRDLLRVFGSNAKGLAAGFSGDVGDGPTDAYKALDPKPWKPSDVSKLSP
jgi:hypothetical protein